MDKGKSLREWVSDDIQRVVSESILQENVKEIIIKYIVESNQHLQFIIDSLFVGKVFSEMKEKVSAECMETVIKAVFKENDRETKVLTELQKELYKIK
jgi:tRNA A22 N-methylase